MGQKVTVVLPLLYLSEPKGDILADPTALRVKWNSPTFVKGENRVPSNEGNDVPSCSLGDQHFLWVS